MKIIDATTFLNEFDLLKLRLAELSDYVDYFVVVESPYTFSGVPKPLYFKENPIRGYKIKHIVVEDLPFPDLTKEQWANREMYGFSNEKHQRDAGFRMGTADADATDLVLVGDADEIVRPSKIKAGNLNLNTCFRQTWYNYWLNCNLNIPEDWPGTGRGPVGFVQKEYMGGQALFGTRMGAGNQQIPDGGWHFSFMGGPEMIKEKLLSFSHAPMQIYANDQHINNSLNNLIDVCEGVQGHRPYKLIEVDKTFPETVTKNRAKWDHLIHPDYRVK